VSRHKVAEGWTAQAYRFALDPTPSQARAMASHVGGARFAYNWGLGLVESRLRQRSRLREQALVEGMSKREADALAATVVVPWNLYALRREWNASKDCVAPWWAANSKEAYSSGLDGLARALRGYLDSSSRKRKGRRLGWPRRKKRRSRASCRFTTGGFGVTDAHHIRLPRIGVMKTHEPTVKLGMKLADATARILSATLSLEAGRWFVSFTCEVCREALPRPTGPVIGVDVGVGSLATVSTGDKVANPKALSASPKRWRGSPGAAPAANGDPGVMPRAVRRLPVPTPGWPTCAVTPCTS
jgi:putative transposase